MPDSIKREIHMFETAEGGFGAASGGFCETSIDEKVIFGLYCGSSYLLESIFSEITEETFMLFPLATLS